MRVHAHDGCSAERFACWCSPRCKQCRRRPLQCSADCRAPKKWQQRAAEVAGRVGQLAVRLGALRLGFVDAHLNEWRAGCRELEAANRRGQQKRGHCRCARHDAVWTVCDSVRLLDGSRRRGIPAQEKMYWQYCRPGLMNLMRATAVLPSPRQSTLNPKHCRRLRPLLQTGASARACPPPLLADPLPAQQQPRAHAQRLVAAAVSDKQLHAALQQLMGWGPPCAQIDMRRQQQQHACCICMRDACMQQVVSTALRVKPLLAIHPQDHNSTREELACMARQQPQSSPGPHQL